MQWSQLQGEPLKRVKTFTYLGSTLGVRVLLEKVTSPRHFVSRVHTVTVCDHTNVLSGDHNTQFPIITEYRKLFLIPKLEGPYPQVA